MNAETSEALKAGKLRLRVSILELLEQHQLISATLIKKKILVLPPQLDVRCVLHRGFHLR